MKLTVVGCAGSFPGPDVACSCYLVEAGGFRLLLDMGNGALGALQRHVDPRAVDALIISHLHADHWADVLPYAFARRGHPDGAASRLPVYGPPGTAERLAAALGKPQPALNRDFDVRTIADGEIGPFAATFTCTSHPVETYAVRLQADGASLAYTADTGPSEAVTALARGADLLLAEASLVEPVPGEPAKPENLHLSGRDAALMARDAGVGRLVLTHLVPWADHARIEREAREVLAVVERARPGAVWEIGVRG
jgi:ribonuclease BN (tRNA processing enzyme)